MKKKILIALSVVFVVALVVLFNSYYTVEENEFAVTFRFSKIENIVSEAGLKFKVPFIDKVIKYPKNAMIDDIPATEAITLDKKTMIVDSYIIWEISDPKSFYQKLGSISAAQDRLEAFSYNAIMNLMGTLSQNDIINTDTSSDRNHIYDIIATSVRTEAEYYGINVRDVKIKHFDLPDDNEQAVFERMISERNQMAEKALADGRLEAEKIKSEVDKKVGIIKSDAQAEAAAIIAEGEAEYMRILAEAYNTPDKQEFYKFTLALEALRASVGENDKIIIGADTPLGKFLLGIMDDDK